MYDLSESIRTAVDRGVLPGARSHFVPFVARWEPPGISAEVRKLADLLPVGPPTPRTPPEMQWDDPAWDTRAQAYQDKGFTWDWDAGAATDGQAYEIARFQADAGQCGFVKYIGTYVQIDDPPIALDFQDPFTLERNGVDVRFLLRFSPGSPSQLGTPPWSGAVNVVPGYGYPNLPYWFDYRFMWGRYANNVWFLVPRHHMMRLFIYVIAGHDTIKRALGRLQGYTQPISTLGAVENVSHGW